MRYLYSAVLTVAAVVTAPYWMYRAVREREYFKSFRQRLGLQLPEKRLSADPVWIHAVSVGEVLAAKPLLSALRRAKPDLPIVVSTVTMTGHGIAQRELAQAAAVFFFPFDWCFSVRRFLNRLNPRAVVLMETELWPNFLRLCSESKIPVFLANGRISDNSFKGYRRLRGLTRSMLRSLEVLGVQTLEDRRRFLKLGAEDSRIRVTGNLKFDFAAPNVQAESDLLQGLRSCLGLETGNQAVVIGSSMRGEEVIFLEAFRKVREKVDSARLIVAPRHPERFDEVAALVANSGFAFCRRSQLQTSGETLPIDILLLDTIGELRTVYSLAAVAVIGGSFMPFGGHNLLEPAALGRAILFGPEMSNFKEMADLFLHEGAARRCSPEALPAALIDLLASPRARALLGQRAAATLRQNQGATQTTVAFILPFIG